MLLTHSYHHSWSLSRSQRHQCCCKIFRIYSIYKNVYIHIYLIDKSISNSHWQAISCYYCNLTYQYGGGAWQESICAPFQLLHWQRKCQNNPTLSKCLELWANSNPAHMWRLRRCSWSYQFERTRSQSSPINSLLAGNLLMQRCKHSCSNCNDIQIHTKQNQSMCGMNEVKTAWMKRAYCTKNY